MSFFDRKGFILRKIKVADIHDILYLQNECLLSPWTENDYRNEIVRNDSISLTAVYDMKIVGFIILRVLSEIDGEIYNLGVSRKHRKKGIGTKLLLEAIQAAGSRKNIKNVWLEVRQSNYAAIDFYQNQGFVITGLRKNFYYNPLEDALLMRLETETVTPLETLKT